MPDYGILNSPKHDCAMKDWYSDPNFLYSSIHMYLLLAFCVVRVKLTGVLNVAQGCR